MRIGFNPQKDKIQEASAYLHQVIVPVYIPNHEGYFKDNFPILKLCLESLFSTIHDKTFVTIVNNGSDKSVACYLDILLKENKIQELIHTENIGKMNAVLKGFAGHKIELVTISDADVLFLSNWQQATYKVFESFPKAGSVSPSPNSRLLKYYTANIFFDKFFSRSLYFKKVKNPKALEYFAKSIGNSTHFDNCHLFKYLTIKSKEVLAVVGGGHFVSTYRLAVLNKQDYSFSAFKLGGESESKILDKPVAFNGYWRLSTADNYAYHMGNTLEDWMSKTVNDLKLNTEENVIVPQLKALKSSTIMNWFKIKIFSRILFRKSIWRLFLRYKGLTKSEAAEY